MYKWFNRVTLDLPYSSQFSFASIFWPGRFSRNHFFLDNAILRRVTFNFFLLNSGLQNNSYSSRHSAPHQERPEIRRNAGLDWKGFAERIWSLFARVKGIRWTSWGTQSGEPLFFLCGRFAFNTFWTLFRRIAFFIFPIFNNCHTLILYSYLRLATNSLDVPVLVSSFCLFAPVSWWCRCYLLFFLSLLYFWYFISRNELHFINLCCSR